MTKKAALTAIAAVAITLSLIGFAGSPVYAADNDASVTKHQRSIAKRAKAHMPGIMGIVTKIDGSTISVSAKNNMVYTVDASSAKILKNRKTTIVVSDIKVGDHLIVAGTVNGTEVSATAIHNGHAFDRTMKHRKAQK
jgi:hypothetical protein